MDFRQIAEIFACVRRGRTVYHDFRDRYALELLQYVVGGGLPVRPSPIA